MKEKTSSIIISIHDCWKAIKDGKKYILVAALACGVLLFYNKLNKPFSYTAEGIFKSSSTSSNGISKALEAFVDTKSERFTNPEDPKTFLLTTPVLQHAVTKLGLQGHLGLPAKGGRLRTIWNNFKIEWAYKHYGKERPSSAILSTHILIPDRLLFQDSPSYLCLANVTYAGEFYCNHTIHFEDEDNFVLLDKKKKNIGNGKIGVPFIWELGSFTLIKKENENEKVALKLKSRSFPLSWIPLHCATRSLEKSVEVKRDKINFSLLNVRYTHSNRRFAADLVNAVMEGYQVYLQKEGERKISKQLKYLAQRQGELESRLEFSLQNHYKSIRECLGEGHFLSLKNEIEFISRSQGDCQSSLLELTSHMLRLKGFPEENFDDLLLELRANDLEISEFSEKFQKLPLSKALQLLSEKQLELEKSDLNKSKYQEHHLKLNDEILDLASFANTFEEPVLKSLFDTVRNLQLRLLDAENWSQKEKERIKKELEVQKQFLIYHLQTLEEGTTILSEALRNEIEELKALCLKLLLNEYDIILEKLRQLVLKSTRFAEKWLAEKKIDLNTTMHSSIVEAITKMIEAKNIAYHTEYVDASPFVAALSPPLPNCPRLKFFFLLGCLGGGIASTFFILFFRIYQGATASYENLKGLERKVIGKLSSGHLPSILHMSPIDTRTIHSLALSLIQVKKSSSLILCSSQSELSFLDNLLELLATRKEKILWISMDSPLEPGLLSFLGADFSTLPIQKGDAYDFLPGGRLGYTQELVFSSDEFLKILAQLKKNYEWIFFQIAFKPQALALIPLFPCADSVVFQVTSELLSELSILPQDTLFLVKDPHIESSEVLPLADIEPILDRLKAKLYKNPVFKKIALK